MAKCSHDLARLVLDVLSAPADDGALLRLDAAFDEHLDPSLQHHSLCDILDQQQHSQQLNQTDLANQTDLDLHDSGSDCMAMDSPEDEPYIDVVSEDSAIQEENIDGLFYFQVLLSSIHINS